MHDRRGAEKIRVFYLIPSLRIGGAEMQLLTLTDGLDKKRFEVSLAVLYRGGELDAAFEAVSGLQVIYLDKSSGFDLMPVMRLCRLLHRRPIDILHAFNLSARMIGILCGKWARVPRIIAAERTDRPIVSSFGSRFYLWLEGFALRLADMVAANSKAGRRFAVRRGVAPERTAVIPNGLSLGRLRPQYSAEEMREKLNWPKDAFIVGMISRLEPIKRPEMFIEILGALNARGEKVYGLIVGDGSLTAVLQRKALDLQIAELLWFVGRDPQPSNWLQIMDLLIHPSQADGCPNAVLEAMAAGVPAIAARATGAEEVIEHERTGLLLESGRTMEWAEAVIRLRRDPALRRRLGEHAAQLVRQKFSAEAMIAAYESLYQNLVERQKPEERMR